MFRILTGTVFSVFLKQQQRQQQHQHGLQETHSPEETTVSSEITAADSSGPGKKNSVVVVYVE